MNCICLLLLPDSTTYLTLPATPSLLASPPAAQHLQPRRCSPARSPKRPHRDGESPCHSSPSSMACSPAQHMSCPRLRLAQYDPDSPALRRNCSSKAPDSTRRLIPAAPPPLQSMAVEQPRTSLGSSLTPSPVEGWNQLPPPKRACCEWVSFRSDTVPASASLICVLRFSEHHPEGADTK